MNDGMKEWMLGEWRKVAVPSWRRILAEANEHGPARRAKYAEWMLSDVLEEENRVD